MLKRIAIFSTFLLLLLSCSKLAHAAGLQIEPVRQEATGQADKATQLRFQVTNPADQAVKVRLALKDVETLNGQGVPSFKEENDSNSARWASNFSAQTSTGQNLDGVVLEKLPAEFAFTLPAKTAGIVEVDLKLPAAAPKSLFFAAFFTASDPDNAKTPVSIQTSIGSLVALTRDDVPATATLEFLPGIWKKADPNWTLPLTLKNTGNIHLKLNGQAWLEPGWGNGQKAGPKSELNPLGRWILPADKLSLDLSAVQHNKWLPELWYVRADFHLNGQQQQKSIPVLWFPTLALIPIVILLSILILIVVALIWRLKRRKH